MVQLNFLFFMRASSHYSPVPLRGQTLSTSLSPVICLRVVRCRGYDWVFAGVESGSIHVWRVVLTAAPELPVTIAQNDDNGRPLFEQVDVWRGDVACFALDAAVCPGNVQFSPRSFAYSCLFLFVSAKKVGGQYDHEIVIIFDASLTKEGRVFGEM